MTEETKTEQKKGCFQRFRTWFTQLSFWKKIIIIFTLNTLILLILTDAIMLALFKKISDDIIITSTAQKQKFNYLSLSQVSYASARTVLGQVDFYANLIAQMVSTLSYFQQNPQIFTSLEGTNPQNPKLTSDFANVSYSEPAFYYYSSNSTFTALPYIDEMLPLLLESSYFTSKVKRITVFVQNNNDPNDLTARTFPATNTFIIPDIATVTDRFIDIPSGNFNVSTPYLDTLSSQNSSELVGIRAKAQNLDNSSTIMFEIELYKTLFENLLSQIYYFQSASVVLSSLTQNTYTYYTATPSDDIKNYMNTYYTRGFHDVTHIITDGSIDEDEQMRYLVATIGLSSSYPLGQASRITNSSSDGMRYILIVDANEIQQPANGITTFLQKESGILTGIVLSWSFVILLSTVALATVVGNYIFHNLKMLSTKMDQYIKDPSKFHNIVIELKQLQLKGILKRLSDNLIAIIEKIEVRKKERKDRINQNYHPFSVGEPKFQERQQLNDYQIIQQIKEQVKVRVQELKQKASEEEISQMQSSQLDFDKKKKEQKKE